MEIETRKVQKLGYSSLGISLPKDWAEGVKLRPGTMVTVIKEEDGSLRVRAGPPEETTVISEVVIDAERCTTPDALTRMITGSYIAGRNTIRVRSRDELAATELKEIHEAVRRLTGLTIVNQGPKFVTVENFAEPTRFPVEGLLRRLHYLTSRMERLALDAFVSSSEGLAFEVVRLEEEVDRLYWLVVRQLLLAAKDRTVAAKIGEKEPRHLVGDRVLAMNLENIGDLWEESAQAILTMTEGKVRIPKDFEKKITEVRALLETQIETTMSSFFASDLMGANQALEIAKQAEKSIEDLSRATPDFKFKENVDFCGTCLAMRSILRPMQQISKYYSSIAQITMNRVLENPLALQGK